MVYNIYFIKTPKCATESLKIQLQKYSETNNLIINDNPYEKYFELDKFNINTNHLYSNEEYFNHFMNSCDKNLPVIRITSVRDPIQRLVSHYFYSNAYYWKLKMDFNTWYRKFYNFEGPMNQVGWNSVDRGNKTNNFMSSYLGVNNIEGFEKKYDFCFVSEYFDESLRKFGKVIDYNFTLVGPANVRHKLNDKYHIDPDVRQLFREKNEIDLEIYNHCLEKFRKID